MNKFLSFSATALTLAAAASAQTPASPAKASARQPAASASAAKEVKEPARGIRFVIRNLSAEPLSELFVIGNDKDNPVVPLRMASRQASARIAWDAERSVALYKEIPPIDEETGKLDEKNLPAPFLVAHVPSGLSSRVLGLIVLAREKKNNRIFYLDEGKFRKGGIHAVNFTSSRIRISISKSGNFKDKQDFILQPFQSSEGVTSRNSWNFNPSAGDGSQIYSFTITAAGPDGKEQKIRSSRFIIGRDISQINLFVREDGRISMSSINLGD